MSASVKSTKIFGDYLLMLAVCCIISVWYYGTGAVSNILACAMTAFFADFIASVIVQKQFFAADFSALVAGLSIAVMLPAGVPVYVCIIASLFAVLVVKVPFGGGMRAPFVPAAAGFAFAAVCFRDVVFTYSGGREFMNTTSIGSTLMTGGALHLNTSELIDMLTGNFYGPMGTGCIIVMAACIVLMLVRRPKSLFTTAGFLGACIIYALVFPRTNGSRITGMFMELCSGSLLFASVFLMTNHATMPKHSVNKVVCGAFTGIICMVMRTLGVFEEPVCFAVILGNAFTPLLDRVTERVEIILSIKQRDSNDGEAEDNEE